MNKFLNAIRMEVGALYAIIILLSLNIGATRATLTVDDSSDKDYASIQQIEMVV